MHGTRGILYISKWTSDKGLVLQVHGHCGLRSIMTGLGPTSEHCPLRNDVIDQSSPITVILNV